MKAQTRTLSLLAVILPSLVLGTGCGKSDSPASGGGALSGRYSPDVRMALIQANQELAQTPFELELAGLDEVLGLEDGYNEALLESISLEKDPVNYLIASGFGDYMTLPLDVDNSPNLLLIDEATRRCRRMSADTRGSQLVEMNCLTTRPLLSFNGQSVVRIAWHEDRSTSSVNFMSVTTLDQQRLLSELPPTSLDLERLVAAILSAGRTGAWNDFGRTRFRLYVGLGRSHTIGQLKRNARSFLWAPNGEWLRSVPSLVSDEFKQKVLPEIRNQYFDHSRGSVRTRVR